ncbi:hypothetical protein JX265_008693 [Neoarthrinium moseri]|uniref:Nudix hydrolase domain-containing protein n=1 Tax=Neoarthrinium moseri TaxID=1658444 RepID=A0A9P9WI43_9PEZI|nr:uncharacterized protein JN550_013272 [Neoarthrinium moseri]KAI1845710.1 hypothetical protein JX266_008075 [Neoarthrinium moseri]KAI1857337.1 hypothetical protein JN550_013272 [Neoarthrinium moseri]KAI1864322.1 hypothetical protein JX265_008693 [Neoarthrinium moseri]
MTASTDPAEPSLPPPTTDDGNNSTASLTALEAASVLQSLRDTQPAPHLEQPLGIALDLDRDLQHLASYPASHYWDASAMAPLNPTSAAAIARLRAYRPPPFPTWDRLPVSRRAAVLVLLFADRRGDLRVVITMRAASLRSFSGHAAFPGGKADSLTETPYQIARREAWEEIGLPMDDAKIPRPFRIEPLCCLPCSLAKTELAVRPCVAFLHADDVPGRPAALVDESMIPRLDAKEVAAVFSGPLHNFLRAEDEPTAGETPPDGDWYDGRWAEWHDEPWRVHNFWVPVNNQRVTKPKVRDGGQAALADELEAEEDTTQRFLVWGLTGRMLVDTARIAYGEEPDFEHNPHYGDEKIIARLESQGRLPEKKRREVGLDAVKDEVKDAKM